MGWVVHIQAWWHFFLKLLVRLGYLIYNKTSQSWGKKWYSPAPLIPSTNNLFQVIFFSCSWFFGSCRERLRRAGRTRSNHLGQIRPSGKTSTVVTHLLGWIEISDFTRDFLEGFPYTKTTMYSFGVTGGEWFGELTWPQDIQPRFSKLFRKWKQISPLQIDSKPQKFQLRVKVWLSEPPLLPGTLAILAKVGGWFETPNKKNMRKSDFPKVWGENNKHLKPPPSWGLKNKLKNKNPMNHQPYQLNPVILFFDFVLVRTGKMQVQNPQAPSLYHNPSLPKTAGKPKMIPKNIPKSSCLDDDVLLYVLAWCQRCLLFPSVFLKKKHINPYTVTIPQVNPSKQVMVLLGKNLLWQTSGGKKPSCQHLVPPDWMIEDCLTPKFSQW